MKISQEKLNIIHKVIETKNWDELDKLNLTEDELCFFYQQYQACCSLEEVDQLYHGLFHTVKESVAPEPSSLLELIIKPLQVGGDELLATIKDFATRYKDSRSLLDPLKTANPIPVRSTAEKLPTTLEEKFTQQGLIIEYADFLIKRSDLNYELIPKKRFEKIKIVSLDTDFSLDEYYPELESIALSSGTYDITLGKFTFRLTLR